MRTYNGKTVNKKTIVKILRTMDPEQIFRLYHQIHGSVERHGVYKFIQEYAPSQKVYDTAYALVWPNKHAVERADIECKVIQKHGRWHGERRKNIVDMLKRECANVTSRYAKRPMLGLSHLYFCSPIHGHKDYNKVRTIPIKGNEHFCELVIRYADRFFGPVYDKQVN